MADDLNAQVEQALKAAPVSDEVRAQAWDDFFSAKEKPQFREKFDHSSLPKDVKAQLWKIRFPAGSATPDPAQPKPAPPTTAPTPASAPKKEAPAPQAGPPPDSGGKGPGPLSRFAKGVYESTIGPAVEIGETISKHPVENAILGPLGPLAHEAVAGSVRGVQGAMGSSKSPIERVESGLSALPGGAGGAAGVLHKIRTGDISGLVGNAAGVGLLSLLLGRVGGSRESGGPTERPTPPARPASPQAPPRAIPAAPPKAQPPARAVSTEFLPPSGTASPKGAPLPEPKPEFGYEPIPPGGRPQGGGGTTAYRQPEWEQTLSWSKRLPPQERQTLVAKMKKAVEDHGKDLPPEQKQAAENRIAEIEGGSAPKKKAEPPTTPKKDSGEITMPRKPRAKVGEPTEVHMDNAAMAVARAKAGKSTRALVTVYNAKGKEIGEIPFNPQEANAGAIEEIAKTMAKGTAHSYEVSDMNSVGKKHRSNIGPVEEKYLPAIRKLYQ